jgi:CRISPR/Cas system-associated exonuclease Cas4 (RecB family)
MMLSHSKVNKYDFCPRAYRYYYIEGWKPKVKKPALLFGEAVDSAISAFFKIGNDPVMVFETAWRGLKESPIEWGKRNSWEGLLGIGKTLIERFVAEEALRFTEVVPENVQRRLTADLPAGQAGLDGLTVVGYPDLYGRVDGRITLVDFKTAQSSYDPDEVQLNEQLTAYWWLLLANGLPVDRVAFCVLLKLKEPRIEWHFAVRTQEEIAEYQDKLRLLATDIERGRFPKKTSSCGQWGGCEYLPLCLGHEVRIRETLTLQEEIPEDEVIV